MIRRLLAGLLVLLIARCAVAQSPTPDDSASLHLSAPQTESLKSIRARFESKRGEVVLKIRAKKVELGQLLKQDDVDRHTIEAKIEEIMKLEDERADLFVAEIFEAKGVLTPAQWGPYRRRVLSHLFGH